MVRSRVGSLLIEKQNLFKLNYLSIIFLLILFLSNLLLNYRFQLHYDESYYWVYSQNLDWSYYDHPPMIALLIKIATLLFRGEFAVRFVPIICTTITCFSVYNLAKYLFDKDVANISLIIILSMPIIQGIYFVTTPDSPLFMFTSLGLYYFAKWVFSEKNNLTYCILSAIFIGLALLSKYTAILLILSSLIFLCTSKKHRHLLLSKGFILSIFIVILIFMPVLFWNYKHNWISFKFQFQHGVDLTQKFNIACLLDYIGSQIAITGIIMLPILTIFIIKNFKFMVNNDKLLFLFIPFIFVLLFFGSRSFFQYMEGNWPGISYLTGVILFAFVINQWEVTWAINYYIILISIIFILCKFPLYFYPEKLRNLAFSSVVNSFHGTKELVNSTKSYINDDSLILACDYGNASQFWFYTNHRVYVLSKFRFAHQYQFWNDNLDFKNKKIYYVCNNNDIGAMDNLKKYFDKIELLNINSYNNKVGTKKIYFYQVS